MILCEQNLAQFHFDFSFHLFEQIAKKLTDKDIELVVVEEEAMREINKAQRGIDKATDVLSFPLQSIGNLPLGSILINANAVKNEAKLRGHSEESEFALLFMHGLLHLLGFNHETDSGEMRAKEKELITHFQLPQSLIIRNEAS